MSDCSAIGRRLVTAGSNLPSQETREANKASREKFDPMDRVFSAPRKTAPLPTGNVCYKVSTITEIAAVRSDRKISEDAVFGTPEEQWERAQAAKLAKKRADRAAREAGLPMAAACDKPGVPQGFRDSVVVGAEILAVLPVKPPTDLLGYQLFLDDRDSSPAILPFGETTGEQLAIMPVLREASDAWGDRMIYARCNIGAFLVTHSPYTEGNQSFTRVEIRHFKNVGSAHKAGEKAKMRREEPAHRFTVSPVLYRSEILASDGQVSRDVLKRDTTALKKPKNYNRSTDWRKQPGGARPAMAANVAYWVAKGA